MQYRQLGKTGHEVSIIAFGGIVVSGMPQSEADAIVAESLDRGVNYFDVAPTYGDAEERLGGAFADKRDSIFLACKTTERAREGAEADLNRTLSRLRTDHADLYQMHGLDSPDDLKIALGPGGAMETFKEAQAAGKIRYIGITGHSEENLLTAVRTGLFDSVLFPVNFTQFEVIKKGPELLAEASKRELGRMAIKTVALGRWADGEERTSPKCWYKPIPQRDLFELALRYALSRDICGVLPPGDVRFLRMALDVAEEFTLIDEEGVSALRNAAGQFTPLFA